MQQRFNATKLLDGNLLSTCRQMPRLKCNTRRKALTCISDSAEETVLDQPMGHLLKEAEYAQKFLHSSLVDSESTFES